jgi:hypothetical protein
MLKVYTAQDLPEAYLLQGLLQAEGIRARVFNEYAQGGLGEIPFPQAYPEVWLERAADGERARAIITRFEQQADSLGQRTCPACGEPNPGTFDLCWQCGAELSHPSGH